MAKPKKINYKAILIGMLVCIAAVLIFLSGLWTKNSGHMAGMEEGTGTDPSAYSSVQPEGTSSKFNISAWITCEDWQEGISDVRSFIGMPDSIQAFAAFFNDDGRLFFTEEGSQMVLALGVREGNNALPVYLTLKNDRMKEDGEWVLKDGSLLKRLLTTENARKKHIDDIVIFARSNGFDGVEVNYENVNGSAEEGFALFCSALHERLKGLDMKLRVVIDPNSEIDIAALPEGPEYVVIAYDLGEAGKEPGPRVDEATIARIIPEMDHLPGDKRIAFATGGFDWDAAGNVQEVTEAQAYELSLFSGDIQRDEGSGMLYFEYPAEDGSTHTIWYADSETLAGWFGLAGSLGYENVALWKMGGITPSTLKLLGDLKGGGLN